MRKKLALLFFRVVMSQLSTSVLAPANNVQNSAIPGPQMQSQALLCICQNDVNQKSETELCNSEKALGTPFQNQEHDVLVM